MSACTEAVRAHHNHRARRVPERSVSRRRREQNKADLDDNPLNGGWVPHLTNSSAAQRKSAIPRGRGPLVMTFILPRCQTRGCSTIVIVQRHRVPGHARLTAPNTFYPRCNFDNARVLFVLSFELCSGYDIDTAATDTFQFNPLTFSEVFNAKVISWSENDAGIFVHRLF